MIDVKKGNEPTAKDRGIVIRSPFTKEEVTVETLTDLDALNVTGEKRTDFLRKERLGIYFPETLVRIHPTAPDEKCGWYVAGDDGWPVGEPKKNGTPVE